VSINITNVGIKCFQRLFIDQVASNDRAYCNRVLRHHAIIQFSGFYYVNANTPEASVIRLLDWYGSKTVGAGVLTRWIVPNWSRIVAGELDKSYAIRAHQYTDVAQLAPYQGYKLGWITLRTLHRSSART
jgi:hypothetical protein